MRLLLDTHIWIWSLLEPEKLNPRLAEVLEDPENDLWLSPISVWEFLILVRRGRLALQMPAEEWVDAALERAPLREAPLTFAVARESERFSLPHRDPADRFLAATARIFELTLVTADRRLLAEPDIPTLRDL